ncbi:hypothetical protein GGR58DRAFT_517325 [Xylaria digitata]|nr:hypothetical protein GGR58DRAFT_517325 [Xylaria digitata]
MVVSTASAEYGRRLLPHIIDDVASKDPQREILLTARSSDPKDGWAPITFGDYANAINRCAQEIVDRYGGALAGTFPTIAYIEPQDTRYFIVVIATIKAGYQALLISPRNTQQAQINLFEKTDCHILWFAEPFSSAVQSWLQEREMQTLHISPLQQWFPTEQVPQPFCVLHTSGSTGFPKPVVTRTGMMAISDTHKKLGKRDGSNYWVNECDNRVKRTFLPMPLFHAAALHSFFYFSVYRSITTVLTIPEKPLSADLVIECLENVDFEATFLPPSILEDISHSEEFVHKLSRLDMVFFGGGNLAREAGDRLVKHKAIQKLKVRRFGSFPIYYHENPELWAYFKFNSEIFGEDWRPFHDDTYELVLVRKGKEPGLWGVFYTFPELDEYSTKDLYKRHPKYPDFWIYYGRADNIVFSNGKKLNPITIEETVQDHPGVQGALVIGSNKFQAGLLLESVKHFEHEEDKRKFLDSVWPLVEKANSNTVAHGQISRELIAVVSPNKPFFRSGKGTIQRASTVQLYAEEIDRLYADISNGSQLPETTFDTSTEESLTTSILQAFKSLGRQTELGPDTDFFSAGIDSLQVMNASRLLQVNLKSDPAALSARFIYRNPTPCRLAQYILHAIASNGTGKAGRLETPNDDQTIILTGSTRGLGSYLLDQLVHNPTIKTVVCLNRAKDGGAAQQEKQRSERGFVQDLEHTNKIEYLHADLSKDKLGLSDGKYDSLLKEAHRIIHHAWPVNFNILTETFEPHLQGVRRLADFAAQAEHRVAVVFISSIGAVHNWDPSRGTVPEERMEDWSLPSNSYGRSKMAGSLILDDAAIVGDFPAASIRVGQIAGPEAGIGIWNKHELVLDVVGAAPGQRIEAKDISGYFHAVNASATTWDQIAPAVQQYYGGRIKQLVDWQEWVDRLEKNASDEKDIDANPGLKLVETYRGMALGAAPVVLDLRRTNCRSKAMAEAPAISAELMSQWFRQWNF